MLRLGRMAHAYHTQHFGRAKVGDLLEAGSATPGNTGKPHLYKRILRPWPGTVVHTWNPSTLGD